MNLKDYTDEEIINECFRRMYDEKSDIIAVKIWQIEDIKYKAGKWCTNEDAKEILENLNIDALADCYDSEWDIIIDAIKEYIQEKSNDTRAV